MVGSHVLRSKDPPCIFISDMKSYILISIYAEHQCDFVKLSSSCIFQAGEVVPIRRVLSFFRKFNICIAHCAELIGTTFTYGNMMREIAAALKTESAALCD